MEELINSYSCVACGQVYAIDPGVCGICSGSEFLKEGEERSRPEQEVVGLQSTESPPAPAKFVLCARPGCGQPVPAGQAHCDYCGDLVHHTQPMSPGLSPEGSSRPVAWLVAPDGTRVPLDEGVPVVFGRSPDVSPWARLAQDNFKVSRRHAEVVVSQGTLHVRDLGSTNGTWLRGIRIDGAGAVEVEDGISIGLSRHLELVVGLT